MLNVAPYRDRPGTLTVKQRECLLLVSQGYSSKHIAIELGISRHTVDQRLDTARRSLGVATRRDAARKFAQSNRAPQPSIYEPIRIDDHSFGRHVNPATLGEATMILEEMVPFGIHAPWAELEAERVAGAIFGGLTETTKRLVIIMLLTLGILMVMLAGIAVASSLTHVLHIS